MPATVSPYLFFPGTAEEAIAHYQSALGATVEMMMRFDESPQAPPPGMIPEGWGKKVMHASFRVGGSVIMASDGCGDEAKIGGFSLAAALPTEGDVDKAFAALSEGGSVQMPLAPTFWSPKYGMCTDKFGVAWMVMVEQQHG